MIFISDIDGTVSEAAPSPLYQGGNNTKEIVIIAPFSGASVVTVAFELPNGLRSSRGLMSLPESCEMTNVSGADGKLFNKNGVQMYAWRYKLPYAITAFSGRLGIQFFFTTADGEVIATSKSYHQIHSGIRYLQDKVNVDELSGADKYIARAYDAALSAENSKTEISNLLSPALDGIIAIQEMLIGTQALYKLNEDKASYTCIGGVNIDAIVIADYVNDKPVTRIAPYAFKNYDKLRVITIPENIKTMGTGAFEGCTALETIYYNAENMNGFESESDVAFKYCGMNTENGTTLIIGKNVTQIPSRLFYGWTEDDVHVYNLTSLSFESGAVCTIINQRAFYSCFNLKHIEIADSVKTLSYHSLRTCGAEEIIFGENSQLYFIDGSALYGSKLKRITLPETLNQINSSAFAECADLKNVTFLGKPSIINATAFNNCPALTDIYVPWAEGEVANAPWGATNATIHYNLKI